ncbi:MAG: response regulator [Rhodobacteraceae bacterium]|nr:response regulator [Paracoccaceae bacterium]
MTAAHAKKLWTWVGSITVASVLASLAITWLIMYPDVQPIGIWISIVAPLAIAPVASYVMGRMWIRIEGLKSEAEAAAEDALSANRQLQDVLKRQQLLFSVLGHEIRTPASSLMMMLDEPGYLDQTENLTIARRSAHHLIAVLDDMRALANPDLALKGTLAIASPGQVIRDAVDSQQIFASKQGIFIEFDLPDDFDLMAEFNTQILRQVAINLVRNCLLHSQASALKVTGHKVGDDPAAFEVRFADNGKGISLSERSTLFEAFARGKTKSEGLGLGLHLCRDFLRKYLDGDLALDDTPGGGATFVVKFAVQAAAEFPDTGETEPEYDFAGKLVLLVEDNRTIRLVTKLQLEKLGASVEEAETGRIGLKMASSGGYDLVLLDLNLPEVKGDDVVRRLRGDGNHVAVIGVTAATMTEDAMRFVEAGADAVLEKPLRVKSLLRAMGELRKAV